MAERVLNKIPQFFTTIYFMLLSFIFFVSFFMTPFFTPKDFPDFSKLNYLFIGIDFLIFLLLYFICRKFNFKKMKINQSTKPFIIILIVGIFFLLAYQVFMISQIIYQPIGDISSVTFYNFQLHNEIISPDIVTNESIKNIANNKNNYLATHRNLMFITGLYNMLYSAMHSLGFSIDPNMWTSISSTIINPQDFSIYFVAEFIACICVDMSIVFGVLCVRKITNNLFAIATFLILILFIGISPNALLVYSDTFAMLIVTSTLFVYMCCNKKWFKVLFISASLIFGYAIKPTCVAVIFAIVFIELIKKIIKWQQSKKYENQLKQISKSKQKNNKNHKKTINLKSVSAFTKYPIVCLLTIVVAVNIVNYVSDFGIQKDENNQLPFTHYLMLGSNSANDGRYFSFDEKFTNSLDAENKASSNLEVVEKRIELRGWNGTFEFLAKKAIITYGAGTFMPKNIYFYGQIREENPIFKILYNAKEQNEYKFMGIDSGIDSVCFFNCLAQMIWIFVLMTVICLLFSKHKNKFVHAISLTLLMITIFLLLFEANERYFLLYAIFPFVLCMYYWYQISQNDENIKIPFVHK